VYEYSAFTPSLGHVQALSVPYRRCILRHSMTAESSSYFNSVDICEQSLWIIPEQFFPIFTLTAMTERKYPFD